jgi:hypothetical protein
MACIVNTFDDVEVYLRNLQGISEEGRRSVIEGYLSDLAERADHFLERYPLAQESYTFQYEFSLIDGAYCFSFRFIVDGSRMSYGVVQVIYVDHEVERIPS